MCPTLADSMALTGLRQRRLQSGLGEWAAGKVGGSMSNVKIIIGKSLQVSSYCRCRGSLARALAARAPHLRATPRTASSTKRPATIEM